MKFMKMIAIATIFYVAFSIPVEAQSIPECGNCGITQTTYLGTFFDFTWGMFGWMFDAFGAPTSPRMNGN